MRIFKVPWLTVLLSLMFFFYCASSAFAQKGDGTVGKVTELTILVEPEASALPNTLLFIAPVHYIPSEGLTYDLVLAQTGWAIRRIKGVIICNVAQGVGMPYKKIELKEMPLHAQEMAVEMNNLLPKEIDFGILCEPAYMQAVTTKGVKKDGWAVVASIFLKHLKTTNPDIRINAKGIKIDEDPSKVAIQNK